MTCELAAGEYRLRLRPERGGAIAGFDWRGEPLMRTECGPAITDSACFPMVPFCNRIAFGQFRYQGRSVRIGPNFPGTEHPHPLHGFGWLSPWDVIDISAASAVLRHEYHPGDWPWPYVSEQRFVLSESGLEHRLLLRNSGDSAMPSGLGFHPYFPRTRETLYRGLHFGEWLTDEDGLPLALEVRDSAQDWWEGRPVADRVVDTVYSERVGLLEITWPDRGMTLSIAPSDNLPFTAVFVPEAQPWFCIEPMSHSTDALNRGGEHALEPGDHLEVSVKYEAIDTVGFGANI